MLSGDSENSYQIIEQLLTFPIKLTSIHATYLCLLLYFFSPSNVSNFIR